MVLPDSLTKIEANAFHQCSKLERVSLPKSLIRIGDCAFKGCSLLSRFELPESVHIAENAFEGCPHWLDVEKELTKTFGVPGGAVSIALLLVNLQDLASELVEEQGWRVCIAKHEHVKS